MGRSAEVGLAFLAVLTALAFAAITLLDVLSRPADAALVDAARGLLAATLVYVGALHAVAGAGNGGGSK